MRSDHLETEGVAMRGKSLSHAGLTATIGILAVLTCVLLLASATVSKGASSYDYTWTDDFDSSSLDPRWSWVNEDPTQWSLSAHPGFLRIMTHSGGVGDKNLLLQSAPTGEFEIQTRVIFTPANNFQIAGLVLYQDNDNYLMLGRAYCDAPPPACVGNGIYFDHVEGGSFIGSNFATSTTAQSEAYLRVVRQGTAYSGYYSEDGISWALIGTHTPNGAIVLSRLGLTAAQGAPEIPADFDFFRLDADYEKVFLPVVLKNY